MGWLIFAGVIFGLCAVIGLILGIIAGSDSMDGFEFVMFSGMGLGIGAFVGFLLAIFPVTWAQVHYNERAISCHVTEKDRGGKEDGMRVYTSCGTFQNTDSILRGKNTSADIWARIHPGTTQEFHVVGWRLGLTSDFPNILEVR